MRRIATILLILLGVFAVSSCDLDPDGTYTFTHGINYSISNKENATTISDYIHDTLGDNESFSITGKQSDAVDQALDRFKEELGLFDSNKICPLLEDGDVIQLVFGLVRKNGIEELGYMTWQHDSSNANDSLE